MNRYRRQITWIMIVALVLGILQIPQLTIPAYAATTCVSGMKYPGTAKKKVVLRKKAGKTYKNLGSVKKNQQVTILGEVKSGSVTWYKCRTVIGSKTQTGYIQASYIKKDSKPEGYVNDKVTTYLNVRKSAKTSAKTLLKLPPGTAVTVLSTKKVSGKYWYRIKASYGGTTKTGYVIAKFITIGERPDTQDNVTEEEIQQNGYVNDKVTSTLNVRQAAGTTSAVLCKIAKGTAVRVLTVKGNWYKIQVSYNKQDVTGYAAKDYITLGEKKAEEKKPSESVPLSDADFETQLAAFPDSYKGYISALRSIYPNWRFVAVDTGLDWNDALAGESVVGKNVIQSNYPKGTNTLAPFSYLSTEAGAYNWTNDTYTVKDGTNWYGAASSVIAYYMDPRNFINDTDIFQFEALSYDESQSSAVVESILSNTFMKGETYVQAFMDAGKAAKANPYFLASRSKQEVGVNGSGSTSGTYSGYSGIYNFYNIGASDGGDAIAKGLLWAKSGTTYGRPWTSPYKSIVGGAQYIAANYILKGQDTLYFQKFNVHPTDSAYLYSHQYMTNVQAPYSEGRITREAYNALGILSDTMIFYIPVYKNMPATPCALPAAAGNPNPYLSSLTLRAGSQTVSLSPSFNFTAMSYSVTVGSDVSAVTVSASTISKKASIEGTGIVNLGDSGTTTTITVVGVAQNGSRMPYTIQVTRK